MLSFLCHEVQWIQIFNMPLLWSESLSWDIDLSIRNHHNSDKCALCLVILKVAVYAVIFEEDIWKYVLICFMENQSEENKTSGTHSDQMCGEEMDNPPDSPSSSYAESLQRFPFSPSSSSSDSFYGFNDAQYDSSSDSMSSSPTNDLASHFKEMFGSSDDESHADVQKCIQDSAMNLIPSSNGNDNETLVSCTPDRLSVFRELFASSDEDEKPDMQKCIYSHAMNHQPSILSNADDNEVNGKDKECHVSNMFRKSDEDCFMSNRTVTYESTIKSSCISVSTSTSTVTSASTLQESLCISTTYTLSNSTVSAAEESVLCTKSLVRHNLRASIRKKACCCECSHNNTLVSRHFSPVGKAKVPRKRPGPKPENRQKSKKLLPLLKIKNSWVDAPNKEETLPMPKIEESEVGTSSSNQLVDVIVPENENKNQKRIKIRKKRRRELDKLYDDLHELDWAKHFCPDNILSQIDIRRAAVKPLPPMHRKRTKHSKNDTSKVVPMLDHADCVISTDISHSEKSQDELRTDRTQHATSYVSESNSDVLRCDEELPSKPLHLSMQSFEKMNGEIHDTPTLETSNHLEPNVYDAFKTKENSGLLNSIASDDLETFFGAAYPFEHTNSVDADFTTHACVDAVQEVIFTVDANSYYEGVAQEIVVDTSHDHGYHNLNSPPRELPQLTSIDCWSPAKGYKSDETPPKLEMIIDHRAIPSKPTTSLISNAQDDYNDSPQNTTSSVPKVPLSEAITPLAEHSSVPPKFNGSYCKKKLICFHGHKTVTKKLRHTQKLIKRYKKRVKAKQVYVNHSKVLHRCIQQSTTTEKKFSHFSLKPLAIRTPQNHKRDVAMSNSTVPSVCVARYDNRKVPNQKVVNTRFNHTENVSQTCMLKLQVTSQTRSTCERREMSIAAQKTSFNKPLSPDKGKKFIEPSVPPPKALPSFTVHYKAITILRHDRYTQIVLKGETMCLNVEALKELCDAVKLAANDSTCHVLTLNGTGSTFCLGLDMKPIIGSNRRQYARELASSLNELITSLLDLKKPLLCVVNGKAVGFGVTLLTHADISIAASSATFSMPHVKLGVVPEGGASVTLRHLIGTIRTLDLFLSGKTLTAQEAYESKLISSVIDDRRIPTVVESHVKAFTEGSDSAIATAKSLIRMQFLNELRVILKMESEFLPKFWLSEECQTALRGVYN